MSNVSGVNRGVGSVAGCSNSIIPECKAQVILQSVINHGAETIVVDKLGFESDARIARTTACGPERRGATICHFREGSRPKLLILCHHRDELDPGAALLETLRGRPVAGWVPPVRLGFLPGCQIAIKGEVVRFRGMTLRLIHFDF
jgi:hypothetical protein